MNRLSYLVVFLAATGAAVAFRGALSGTSEASPAITNRPPATITLSPKPLPKIDHPPREAKPELLPPPRAAEAEEPPRMVGPDGTPIQRLD
jgi:hypothetical protein